MSKSQRSNKTSGDKRLDECSICLQPLDGRGGVPIMSPGCCGKFFHQPCVNQLIATGANLACPNCRTAFPAAQNPIPTIQQQSPLMNLPQAPPAIFQARPSQRRFPRHNPSKMSADEEIIPDVTRPMTITAEELPTTISISCTPERSETSMSDCEKFFVNINLKAAGSNSMSSKIPMDIVCVLDNSGSMNGSKLNSVKEAMRFVRSQLTEDDRLSVVIFNSTASTLHGLFRMTTANKEVSANGLDAVYANGGTSIYSGMKSAVDILDARRTKNSVAAIFLLTDGQDSSRMAEKKALGGHIRKQGYSLFAFGFGNDHDSAQMQEIANAAEGPFTFVEQDSMVVDAFGGALGGQQGILGTNVRLRIATEVPLLQTYAGRYSAIPGPDGKSVEVVFANIFAHEQRDVLLKLRVPSCVGEVDRYKLLSATVEYQTMDGVTQYGIAASADAENAAPAEGGGIGRIGRALDTIPEGVEGVEGADGTEGAAGSEGAPAASAGAASAVSGSSSAAKAGGADPAADRTAECFIKRMETPSTEGANLAVDVQRNRALVNEVLAQALVRADQRDLGGARKLIDDTLASVKTSPSFSVGNSICASLVEDLDEGKRRLRDDESYFRSGGRAEMCEMITTLGAQRSVYRKVSRVTSCYQSPSSVDFQGRAYASRTPAAKDP